MPLVSREVEKFMKQRKLQCVHACRERLLQKEGQTPEERSNTFIRRYNGLK